MQNIKSYGLSQKAGISGLVILLIFNMSQKMILAQSGTGEVLYFENRVTLVTSSFSDIIPRPHYLGEEIGKKYAVFNDLYSYTITGEIYHTGPQLIIKLIKSNNCSFWHSW